MVEVADRYRSTRLRVTALVGSLDADDDDRPVPACPGWTVHDLVSHITGVADDALNGRMEGVTTDPWTAAQVERGRELSIPDLLARWTEQAAVFERFPLPPEAVVDLTTHEQDLRGALDRPGARGSDELLWAFGQVATWAVERVPGLRIEATGSGPTAPAGAGATYGPAEATAVLRGEPFELYRALLGRRSLAQVRDLDWERGAPDDLSGLMVFGPAPADVVE